MAEQDSQKAAPEETGDYRVLARKYRPSTFSELVGQEAVVRTLSNAIEKGRLAHAFILTGVRGVGKTTTARLLARALNCTGADGKGDVTTEPCGTCDNCVAIAESRHVDVLEMDAASRTGVDDVREIIDTVRYAPVSARHKIYIIDEVHMLSKNAFNALLKTLEEPPPHVKFIFATTEVRKLPVTVLSRCQRFDLRRVPGEKLVAHMDRIVKAEDASVSKEALTLLARAAEGSVRDALSLLDQALAHGSGATGEEDVRKMLGLADRNRVLDLFEALMQGDMPAALGNFREQFDLGADPLVILRDLADVTHTVTRIRAVPGADTQALLSGEQKDRLADFGKRLGIASLGRVWQLLLKGMGEVQHAPLPAEAAEMVLIRIAHASGLPTPEEALRKLKKDTPEDGGKAAETPPDGQGAETVDARAAPPQQTQAKTQTGPEHETARSGGARVVALKKEEDGNAAEEAIPASFRGLVELFERRREGVIGTHLRDDVGLVSYKPGYLAFAAVNRVSNTLPGRIRDCLEEWTGRPWQVVVENEAREAPLREQDEARLEEKRAGLEADPLVKSVTGAFPGARIVEIRERAEKETD